MIPITVEMLADVVGGELLGDPHDIPITGVAIDSRKVMPGDLFVALPGEHVDGHDFLSQAAAAGAVAHLCLARRVEDADEEQARAMAAIPGIVVVDDVQDALTGLGAWVRDTVDPTVVAITGSNGKTTTKDLTAAAIGAARVTVANPGSFNNELGLPLTLCLLTAETEVLVCEIGARGIGHIASLMPVVRPDVAVVTTVAGAHLGEFGSIEAIWQAKGELVEALDVDGVAVLNADLEGVDQHADRAGGRVVTFGFGEGADLHPVAVRTRDDGHAEVTLPVGDGGGGQPGGATITFAVPLPGRHNVANALAALCAARAAGVDLETAARGLETAAMSRWRMEVAVTSDGVTVVNDAYNANPHSMVAALDTAAAMPADGRRLAVLGYMAELGDTETAQHADVGRHLAGLTSASGTPAFAEMIVVDPRADGLAAGAAEAGFTGQVHRVADAAGAADLVARQVRPGDLVLVKASRSIGLEVVAERLLTAEGAA